MTKIEILDAARGHASSHKVSVGRGKRNGRMPAAWFSRPADEHYLSLSDLFAALRGCTERCRIRTIESAAIPVDHTDTRGATITARNAICWTLRAAGH